MTLSRREFLRGGVSAAALGVLAACGIRPTTNKAASRPLGKPTGELVIANWPLYIDVDPKTKKRPTIEHFQRESHIHVTYKEVIDDNSPFFGTIKEPLAHGKPTGWDIVVVTDWLAGRMQRLGYLERLHRDRLPLVRRYEGIAFEGGGGDPNFSVPWQAGITGIAYNRKHTGRTIDSFGDLFDPAFKGKVGMLSDMRDMLHLTMLWMGVDPQHATTKDVKAARDKLLEQRHAGIVRAYYEDDYTDALARGDVVVTLAYSGDVFQLQADDPDLEFVVPKEGGMLFVDEMVIPKGAEHIADAHEWMNYVYNPSAAAELAAALQYICPVPAAQALLREQAQKASGAKRTELETIASSPLVFPTKQMESHLHRYRVLSEAEERTWNDLFAPVVGS